jgi:diguanylate cyclase (GGDEF)-like protein
MEALEAELARCRREARPLALVLVDADHFKRINDEHGHLAGDAVLREIAQRLQASTRSYDRVGRYGGEEFLLLLPGLDTRQDADRDRIAEFHRVIAAQPFVLPSGQLLSVTCSFGVAQATFDAGADSAQLIGRADQALYRAKQAGRNRVEHAV